MSFSERIKLDVKRKAGFRCCRCTSASVEVHHITPKEGGGSDTFENAAPLCPSCHSNFGDNPKKRKEITQMRDWWYTVASNLYPQAKNASKEELEAAVDKLQTQVEELKHSSENAPEAPYRMQDATRLADQVHANFQCKNCGTAVGLLIGGNSCPTCGMPIS